jgi:hypothetical protein
MKNVMTGRTGQGDRTRPVTTGQAATCASEGAIAVTGHASAFDRTRCTRRPVGVQRAPTAIGRVRSQVTGSSTHPISSMSSTVPKGVRPDALVPRGTGRAGPRPPCARLPKVWTDRTRLPCPVISTTASGHCFSVINILDFRHLLSPPVQWKIGVSLYQKAPNPAEQARREGERNSNPPLPLKLHRLCKCANTTKCAPPCAYVLAFSQLFFKALC